MEAIEFILGICVIYSLIRLIVEIVMLAMLDDHDDDGF